jgi:hypothetical protein
VAQTQTVQARLVPLRRPGRRRPFISFQTQQVIAAICNVVGRSDIRCPLNCSEIRSHGGGIGNALASKEPQSLFRSRTVELKPYAVAPRAPLDSNAGFRGLRLVRPCAPETPKKTTQAQHRAFSSAEMRHSFAIWSLDKEAPYGRRLHLYYCLRCKWSFSVDDRRGSVTPLDLSGYPVEGAEAAERLATFSLGPCPIFNHRIGNSRLTQQITAVETIRTRLVSLLLPLSAPLQRLISWTPFGRQSERCAPKTIVWRGRRSQLASRGNQNKRTPTK